jgi:multisubunit Na+/H+ antiporter MnhC subunit
MFEQTLSGTLRNLAIVLVLTAVVVGAGFALAFS